MRKILTVCTGLILLLLLISCSEKQEADWTILIYMAADNGLNIAALGDIEEMMAAEFSDRIVVIVQIDESQYAADPFAKRYRIYPGSKNKLADLGEIDSGDYNVLTEFANWGFDKYPSHRQALFIWGHGNGWYNAYNRFCPDNQSLNAVSVPDGEFALALKKINSHLDILVLDACNMLAMEVISEVYSYAGFILGSETEICPDGFPYDEILSLWENYSSTQALADQMALTYANSYMPSGSQNPYYDPLEIAMSTVNTLAFPALQTALSDFVFAWQDSAGTEIFLNSRQDCLIEFNDLFAEIDLLDYFTKLKANSIYDELSADCTNVLNLIDQVFTSQFYLDLNDISGTEHYPAGTATIWFPTSKTTFDDLQSEYEKLKFSETGWQQFLQNSFLP